MRKLCSLLLIVFIFSASSSSAGTVYSTNTSSTVVASKTPVGMIVQGFFRKIFTGKEQMSERKRKRILARQK